MDNNKRQSKRPVRNSPAAREAQRQRRARERREDETARREEQERQARAEEAAQRRREARDSRAAQTAQRHREERREREHLDDLRQQQKRKAKQRSRTKKRVSPETWKRLAIMAGVVAALVLSMVIFFRVRHLEVRGSDFYTAQEIIDASGVAEGDNLLTVARGQVAGNIMARLEYVRSVQVARQLPDTLILTVTEYEATFAVQDAAEDWYLVTAGGKVVERIGAQAAEGHIKIADFAIVAPELGETMQLADGEGRPQNVQTRRDALLKLLQEIEDAELIREVTSVSAASTQRLCLTYDGRFTVELGGTGELAYKLELLKYVMAEQKDSASGTIDLTLKQGKQAYVSLDSLDR